MEKITVRTKYIRHPQSESIRYVEETKIVDGEKTISYGWCTSDSKFNPIPPSGIEIDSVLITVSQALLLFK